MVFHALSKRKYSSRLTKKHLFARRLIADGCGRKEDAVQEALALWEERERRRAEILAAVDEAENSIANGQGRIITQQSVRDLAQQLKQKGRESLITDS